MADWSDADIKTVKSMWQRGATATAIAAALGPGITRGAVLGKIHRLGLKRAEDAEPVRREPEPSGPRPIWALGQCQCRWPIGNLLDPPGLFCGAATADGSSWCSVHERLVYAGTARPRPEAAPAPRLAALGGRSRF